MPNPSTHFPNEFRGDGVSLAGAIGMPQRAWRRMLTLGLVLFSGCASHPGAAIDASTSPDAVQSFVGSWAYAQSCGWQHSANFELEPGAAKSQVQGRWADGTRVRGESGGLRGEMRDGKLWLRFCRDDMPSAQAQGCTPSAEPAEPWYLVRRGERIEWYRGPSPSAPYLSLHRVIAGQEIPKDDNCPEDE
jgi:hypothetical protein